MIMPPPNIYMTSEELTAWRSLAPPTADDVSNLRLKTPAAPPSRYLIAHLEAEGWPFLPSPGPNDEAA